jgi:uncharacterized protein YndB with AHSA1/START domain
MKTDKNLSTESSVLIHASAQSIWDVLTDPDKIKRYLFGSEVSTDWKVGSPVTFSRDRVHSGAAPGNQPIVDKGQILAIKKNELLQYTYFSSQEGYEEKPENHTVITWTLRKENDQYYKLTYLREKIPIEFEQKNQERFLPGMLEQIKKLAEQGGKSVDA